MPPAVNPFNRVQQWTTFARQWWLYDAYGQDPFLSAMHLRTYLLGKHKPIFHPQSDVGDHVVVMNSKYIAMEGDLWERIEYFHHTRYPGGGTWTPAWQMHQEDPAFVLFRACKRKIKGTESRKTFLQRLHIFPEATIPEHIHKNITGQIRQLKPIAKRLADYTKEERETFPRLVKFPKDYVLDS